MKNSHSSRLDSRLAFLSLGLRLLTRISFTVLLLHLLSIVSLATPLNEYRKHLESAVSAVDTLGQIDESESEADRAARVTETIAALRVAVPETENVEWEGVGFRVDNSWLHRELQTFENGDSAVRSLTLKRMSERLQAVAQRVAELESANFVSATSKAEARQKLTQILQRPEYARTRQEASALSRLIERFVKWLESFFPKRNPSGGGANILSLIAQFVVVLAALAVIVYAVRMFAPRFFRRGRTSKKEKSGARIVLGEKLQPDESAVDLLAEAEALAQRGELRAAIRKAYIALLVELGDRKVISLAQHKTNRDYLAAVREHVSLYGYVKQLTDSFERHWYGFAKATDADWVTFRTGYKQALIQ